MEIKSRRMMEIKEIGGKLAMKEIKMNTMNPNKSQSITINHNLISINHNFTSINHNLISINHNKLS